MKFKTKLVNVLLLNIFSCNISESRAAFSA